MKHLPPEQKLVGPGCNHTAPLVAVRDPWGERLSGEALQLEATVTNSTANWPALMLKSPMATAHRSGSIVVRGAVVHRKPTDSADGRLTGRKPPKVSRFPKIWAILRRWRP